MKSFLMIVALFMASVEAFAPSSRAFRPILAPTVSTATTATTATTVTAPSPLQRQRCSVAQVQTMVFGLGAPEIAVVLVAAAFLLGPQKLAELGKDAGKIAGELKEVPKEFQAGLKEGEQAAMANKQEAKVVDAVKEASTAAATDEKKENIA